MRILLQAEFAELERLTNWVAALRDELRLPQRTAHDVDLCLTELVTNIASYAYPGGEIRKPVEICASRNGDRLVLEIEDRGVPFDPGAYVLPELPKSLADAAIGGRGLRLVRHFSDEIAYCRDHGTNRVILSFSLANR